MQKDITEKRLEDWNDVFADIFNNLVFGGEEVLKEENLVALPTESFSRNQDGTLRQGNRDVRKADRRSGSYRLICGEENQQGIDNTMPQRIMGYEYAAYEEQVKKLMDENKTHRNPAYTKRIHDNQRLAPVVTAVLYWGTEDWIRPRTLHDMLEFPPETAETIRPYVADYPMNLIPLAKLPKEVRGRLKSDFRLIAEYVANRTDPEALEKVMQDHSQKIRHPEEFLDVLSEVAEDQRFKEMKEQMSEEKKEEGLYMCTILDEYGEAKKLEGKNDHLIELICKKLRKGKSQDVIAEEVEENLEQIQEICRVAAAFAPEYESAKVYEAWSAK